MLQSPLGFATLDKAAALDLATVTPLTDLRQYINSDLGFSDLKIYFLYSKIATVVVAKARGWVYSDQVVAKCSVALFFKCVSKVMKLIKGEMSLWNSPGSCISLAIAGLHLSSLGNRNTIHFIVCAVDTSTLDDE